MAKASIVAKKAQFKLLFEFCLITLSPKNKDNANPKKKIIDENNKLNVIIPP